jgi:tRNA 5-methylaminomethyl-2-thiouridine biosynthesis bifunctional protein
LQGCGLLAAEKQAKLPHTASHASNTAWASQPQWHVLDTHFGRGLNFLATWAAWRADPQRPARLFFTSTTAQPAPADELRHSARAFADLGGPAEAKQLPVPSADMIDTLTAQWHTLLPGLHRLVFEGGAVQLTLCVGARAMRAANAAHGAGLSGAEGVASAADAAGAVDAADATNDLRTLLRELDVAADSIFLTHSSPDPSPALRDLPTLKSVAQALRQPGPDWL